MAQQKQAGKAFEYAVIEGLRQAIGTERVEIIENQMFVQAVFDFNALPESNKLDSVQSAIAAGRLLLKFEPRLLTAQQGERLNIFLQSDQLGGIGDVRDIVIKTQDESWEIGISAKHHHEALKHSRLSQKIDFGARWIGVACTQEYFQKIQPIFDNLRQLRAQNLAWSDMPNKEQEVYVPLLEAFKEEMLRLDRNNPGLVARAVVSYLIGVKDFYKIIKLKSQTKVQVFNFNGTLNTGSVTNNSAKLQPELRLDKLKLPSRIVELEFRKSDGIASNTTLDMICDAGWQISFRLHNASTKVETSLKFDINLVGMPNNLQTFSVVPDVISAVSVVSGKSAADFSRDLL